MMLVACATVVRPSEEPDEPPFAVARIPDKPPLPAGTILCDKNTPCPQGMRCVCYETLFDTDDPLEGVEHCEPSPDLSLRELSVTWDAGTLRDLDKALDADAP